MTTIRCADGHQFDLGDPDGKILKAGYRRCPRTGCLRNGFVVKETEDDMKHLDPVDVCGTLDYLEQRRTNGKIIKLYNELITAVESKYPNESKHETALRYIKDREIKVSYSCSADLPVTTK